jgi:hypothetical protein
MQRGQQVDTYGKVFVLVSLTFLSFFWAALIGVTLNSKSVEAIPLKQPSVLAGSTQTGPLLKIYPYPQIVKSKDIVLKGEALQPGSLSINNIAVPVERDPATGVLKWQKLISLSEGQNTVRLVFTSSQGVTQTYSAPIISDTVAPTCGFKYSKQPAPVGELVIKLECSETITPVPRISINQQGSKDVIGVRMMGEGRLWSYTYSVQPADGISYKNGTAQVGISTFGDIAGNPIGAINNRTFEIKAVKATAEPTEPQPTEPTPTPPIPTDEVETTGLPQIRINEFSEQDLPGVVYLPGNKIKLRVVYRQVGDQDIDGRINEYVYLGSQSKSNFTGLYIDFSKIDTNFKTNKIVVSPRVTLSDTGFYSREVEYKISLNNRLSNKKVLIPIQYLVNGKVISSPAEVELEFARKPVLPTVLAVSEVNKTKTKDIKDEVSLDPAVLKTDGLQLSGVGPANTTLDLRVFSDPVLAQVITDDQGNWEYTLKQELTPGSHTVYAALANSNQVPQNFTQIFSFRVAAATVQNPDQNGNQVEVDETDVNVNDNLAEVANKVKNNTPLQVLLAVMVGVGLITAATAAYLIFQPKVKKSDELIPAV